MIDTEAKVKVYSGSPFLFCSGQPGEAAAEAGEGALRRRHHRQQTHW